MKLISLYKFVSERELQEIMERNFKEFPPHFPMHFYSGEIPETAEKQKNFLVKFEVNEKNRSHCMTLEDGKLVIDGIEDLSHLNSFIEDRIKMIKVFEQVDELDESTMTMLENVKTFFECRLQEYLETNSREVISYDYFRKVYNPVVPTEEEREEDFKKLADEQKAHLKYWEEKTSTINTVEEAVNFLVCEELNAEAIREMKNRSLASVFNYPSGYWGLGISLRNMFIYPNKNENFLQHLKDYDSQYIVDPGESGEGFIEDLLWRELNNYRITDESKKKIKEIRKKQNKETSLWSDHIRERLVSYNLDETIIEEYLNIENKYDTCVSTQDYERCSYEQKRILAGLSGDEISVYNEMKQDYFMISNLIENIKQKS